MVGPAGIADNGGCDAMTKSRRCEWPAGFTLRALVGPLHASALLAGPMLLSGILVLAAACGGGGNEAPTVTPTAVAATGGVLTLQAFDFGYDPPVILVQEGERVEIILENGSSTLHNWKVDDLPADAVESMSSGALSADEGELFVGAKPDDTGSLGFVPQQSGSFVFYCTIRGHRSLGMEGTIIVE